MYGGASASGSTSGDTYIFDLDTNDWQKITPTNSPPALTGLQMVYDTTIEKSILFGGNNSGLSDETWVYDYGENTWTMVTTGTVPTARSGHTMLYDSFNSQSIIFGGRNSTYDELDDTWLLNIEEETVTESSVSKSSTTLISSTTSTSIKSQHHLQSPPQIVEPSILSQFQQLSF